VPQTGQLLRFRQLLRLLSCSADLAPRILVVLPQGCHTVYPVGGLVLEVLGMLIPSTGGMAGGTEVQSKGVGGQVQRRMQDF